MLIDTSAWLDYLFFRKDDRLEAFMDNYLAYSANTISIVPIIYQEVLQGMRYEKDYRQFQSDFQFFQFHYYSDQEKAALRAATLYRKCRKKGVTVRKPNDCMIALFALDLKLPILAIDRDFAEIAKVHPLQLVTY
ncbi:MAG: PIN domain-containing protein [Tunicatimonas sp.]|uniref:type II toxin-antitoxin system VapC family toxin n=1 Tax=Tunicatimonas sp. TaxID=1940096 RepID=UPI003C722A7E